MKLIVDSVSKSYGKNLALSDFSADFEPGIYALLGPNGAGKTTLMNIITDNLKADSGTIRYCEENSEERDVSVLGREFRKKIGYMPQYPGMYPNFTIEEFLFYIAALKNIAPDLPKKDRKKAVSDQIERLLFHVELLDVKNSRIGALSGGMRQRLGLAQALLGDPSIIILDEPTAGLDPKQRIKIRNLISEIALNKIVIIATHVVSDIEFIAKKAIILKNGKTVDFASPSALCEKMKGKVWQVRSEERNIAEIQQKYDVIQISKDTARSEILLRVLSETKPEGNALPVEATIEDYYLYTFRAR